METTLSPIASAVSMHTRGTSEAMSMVHASSASIATAPIMSMSGMAMEGNHSCKASVSLICHLLSARLAPTVPLIRSTDVHQLVHHRCVLLVFDVADTLRPDVRWFLYRCCGPGDISRIPTRPAAQV